MKLRLFCVNAFLAILIFSTLVVQGQNLSEDRLALKSIPVLGSLVVGASVDLSDTLSTRRNLLSTRLYKKGELLSKSAADALLKDTPRAQKLFQTGNKLKPIGPLISVAGLVLGYIGIQGTPETAMIRGIHTIANPNVPDVQVYYTKRSLPKLLAGVGLFVGGLCLIELSNELTRKSVVVYNTNTVSQKSLSQIRTIKIQLTDGGQLGLLAQF